MFFYRNAVHCVTLIRFWYYQVDRSTLNAHIEYSCLTLTTQDAEACLAQKAMRENKALKRSYSFFIILSVVIFVRSVSMVFGWIWLYSSKLKGSDCARSGSCGLQRGNAQELREGRPHLPWGVLFPGIGQQKQSCNSQCLVCISKWTQKDTVFSAMIVFSSWMT